MDLRVQNTSPEVMNSVFPKANFFLGHPVEISQIYRQKGLKCDWGILLGYNYEQPLYMKMTLNVGSVIGYFPR